jgi:hypothetical protein
VRLALDLWKAEGVVGLWEIPQRLGPSNFQRVLAALELCRHDRLAGEPAEHRQAA